jgi:hypothetical protein
MTFLTTYMELGLVCEEDGDQVCKSVLYQQLRAYATAAILESNIKEFKCSDVACAIIFVSREDMLLTPWSKRLTEITQASPAKEEIQKIILCFRSMVIKPLLGTVFSRMGTRTTPPSSPTQDSTTRESLHIKTPVAEKENSCYQTHSPVSITEVEPESITL